MRSIGGVGYIISTTCCTPLGNRRSYAIRDNFKLERSLDRLTEMGTTENITMELLEVPQREINSETATEISDYFFDYDEGEWEDLGYEDEKEIEDDLEEVKELEKIDIFADLLTQFHDKRAARIAAQLETEKGKLLHLIGIKKKRDVSEETLITPEEISPSLTVSSTESSIHPCLKDIDISDSQLKLQNLFTLHPLPDDPGLIPAFWTIHERRHVYSEDGIQKFFDLSKTTGIKPIKSLKDMLLSDRINLQYYGVNPRVVRPLCEALMSNPFVLKVNLTGNWLSEDACFHLNELLLKNHMIHTLILSGCKIGPEGAAKIQGGILGSVALKELDLSDCNIRNEGFGCISYAIRNNESIETLSVNNNHLDESCSEDLQKLFAGSKTLKNLQLSWNSLYTAATWKNIVKGLEHNETLVNLDLSWNALGKECIPYLRQILSRPSPLKILHLNGNRFNNEDVPSISRGLSTNQTLEELYLGNNPIKAEGVLRLVTAITPAKATAPAVDIALRVLDLTNLWGNKAVQQKLDILQHTTPWLDIKLGGILSNYKLEGPDVKAILLKRANYEAMKPKKKRLRKNFGHFVLTLPDNPVSKAAFAGMIKTSQQKLSQTLINEIIIAFAGASGTVDLELLKSVYMMHYPNTKPPPEKSARRKKKKGKGKKGKKQPSAKVEKKGN